MIKWWWCEGVSSNSAPWEDEEWPILVGFRAPIMQQRLATVLGRASTEKSDVLPTVETPHKSRAFRSYLLHSLTIWVLLNIIFIHVPRNIGRFEIYQPVRRGRKIFIGAGLPCWLHTAPKDRSSLSRSLGKENSKTSYILRIFTYFLLTKSIIFPSFFWVFWDQISNFLCGKPITIPTIPFKNGW